MYQFIRFIFIGIINTIFYYVLYVIFLYFNNYVIAIVLANGIGIFFSFKTFAKYVFFLNKNNLFFKFIIVYMWNIIFNIILVKLFNLIINNYYIDGLLATIIVAINSYILNKKIVFKE